MKARVLGLLTIWLATMGLSGCAGSVPVTHYYTFQASLPTTAETTPAKYSYTLGLAFEADELYEQNKIVFRPSSYEVSFYEYHRWLRPPVDLVAEQAQALFTKANLVQKVFVGAGGAEYVLQGRLLMCDQWYTAQRTSSIQVVIAYQLVRAEDAETLWQTVVETTATTATVEILETIKAFESAVQGNLTQTMTALDQFFAQPQE